MRTMHAHSGPMTLRRGDCQRCGWTEPLVRLDRQDRRRLGVEVSLRWMCQDCRATLLGTRPSGQRVLQATVASDERQIGDQSVA